MILFLGVVAWLALEVAVIFLSIFYWVARICFFIVCLVIGIITVTAKRVLR